MKLPRGQLVRSRVVTDLRTVLVDALERELTGYAVLDPQESLLLDAEGSGILVFRLGVPRIAFHTGTERGGPPALADLAAEGPYRLELFAVAVADLTPVTERPTFRVPAGMPAERLAGDPSLADRTRAAAAGDQFDARGPASEGEPGSVSDTDRGTAEGTYAPTAGASDPLEGSTATERQVGAVEAFLDNEEKIAAIREHAREEATRRAEEWGFCIDRPHR